MNGYQALPGERCGNCKYFRKHYTRWAVTAHYTMATASIPG